MTFGDLLLDGRVASVRPLYRKDLIGELLLKWSFQQVLPSLQINSDVLLLNIGFLIIPDHDPSCLANSGGYKCLPLENL